MLNIIYALCFYFAFLILIFGLSYKLFLFSNTPNPLKIPQTPAPKKPQGVIIRIFQEIFLFKSLFKGDRMLWLAGLSFHLSLFLVIISHLRFCFEPLFPFFFYYNIFFQLVGHYSSYIFLLSLLYLFIRRLLIDKIFYISLISDYFILILLFFIGASGVILKYFIREDIVSVKVFILSLLSFHIQEIPKNPVFLIHFTLVLILFMYFPFSKLIHSIGIFFSPTRMQPDAPRKKRYINIWQE